MSARRIDVKSTWKGQHNEELKKELVCSGTDEASICLEYGRREAGNRSDCERPCMLCLEFKPSLESQSNDYPLAWGVALYAIMSLIACFLSNITDKTLR